jgi:poly(3-hydroxybutyrate) depolymerase
MKIRAAVVGALQVGLIAVCGCAVPQAQDTPVSQWREIDPVSGRAFYIYVPSTYHHSRPAPLVVSCHGTPPYDIAEHHIRELKMLGETNGCIIVAPELVATDGLIGDGPIIGMLDDERFILSLISMLGYRYNIDLNKIMITGFSGGGFPVYWVGLRHPEIFSTVVPRSCNFSKSNLDGWYPTASAAAQKVMIYYTQNDPATISGQSKQGIEYLRSKGFSVHTHVIPGIGHERRPEYAMKFFRDNWTSRARPSQPPGRR